MKSIYSVMILCSCVPLYAAESPTEIPVDDKATYAATVATQDEDAQGRTDTVSPECAPPARLERANSAPIGLIDQERDPDMAERLGEGALIRALARRSVSATLPAAQSGGGTDPQARRQFIVAFRRAQQSPVIAQADEHASAAARWRSRS